MLNGENRKLNYSLLRITGGLCSIKKPNISFRLQNLVPQVRDHSEFDGIDFPLTNYVTRVPIFNTSLPARDKLGL